MSRTAPMLGVAARRGAGDDSARDDSTRGRRLARRSRRRAENRAWRAQTRRLTAG